MREYQDHLEVLVEERTDADSHDKQARDQARRIKTAWSETRCIALVEDTRQGAWAEEAGADATLLKVVMTLPSSRARR